GEEDGRAHGEGEADRPHVLRPVALGGERDPAADDRERPEDERRADRLAEEQKGDRDRNERRRADGDRRARGAGDQYRPREQNLRAARREQAGEEELPAPAQVVSRQRGEHRQRRPPPHHRERTRGGPAAHAEANRHGHRAEARRRDEREENGAHAALARRTRRTSTSAGSPGIGRFNT